jgi:cholesterol oxidase
MSNHWDAIVVGSGFGGSIAALRIAQAGKSVLVLERGKRYKPGDFPRDPNNADALFFRPRKRPNARGLYEFRSFSGIGTVCASGVGGGSLVYANIHVRPDPVIFDDPRWPKGYDRKSLDPYYDRVAGMLEVAPLPTTISLRKRDVFRSAASSLGREVFDPDEAVAWSASPGKGRSACKLCAECEFGCQHGAKNTLDYNYLAKAESYGATIQPNVMVSHVEHVADSYRVFAKDLETGEEVSYTGRRVVISAGTIGTNEILFRSRDETRTLPNLSDQLGVGHSGNGDFLGSLQNSSQDLEPWNGPDVTSVMRFFDKLPGFTLAAPTFNRPVTEFMAAMGQSNASFARPLTPIVWPYLDRILPWAFSKGFLSKPGKPGRNAGPPSRMTSLFAIGQDNAGGRVHWKSGKLDIAWDYAKENADLVSRMHAAMSDIARVYGGTYAPLPTWDAFRRIITVHPLGGCRLAESPDRGVVSPEGQVFHYPGLFVADGSVIPTAIGFHPVMTISAVAERIADAVVASYP